MCRSRGDSYSAKNGFLALVSPQTEERELAEEEKAVAATEEAKVLIHTRLCNAFFNYL